MTTASENQNATPVTVTVDNFKRAETDTMFSGLIKRAGLGKFFHHRELQSVENQPIVRPNRDTLYSVAILDLSTPATVTLPDAGGRFLSLQIVNEDQYTPLVIYQSGSHTLTQAQVGTRYCHIIIRIFVNPSDPSDLTAVHALQDAIRVEQAQPGTFEIPNWDQESRIKIHNALVILSESGMNSSDMFGRKEEVNPVHHLIGTAIGWGGNPASDATYILGTVPNNDGKTIYRVTVKDVPVDGFWSISVYNAEGFFEKNPQNAYTLNNITAKPNADGSVTIQFGGCDGNVPNCLPIMPGWNYAVRLYRPRQAILDGTWKFPEAQPV